MALTSSPYVWKRIALVAGLLCIFFLLCYFFATLFVTFVVGFSLILIAERSVHQFHSWTHKLKLSERQRLFLGLGALLCVTFVLFFMLGQSLAEVADAYTIIDENGLSLSEAYAMKLQPLLPEFISKNLLTVSTVRDIEAYVTELSAWFFTEMGFFFVNAIIVIPLLFHLYFSKRSTILKKALSAIPMKYRRGFQSAIVHIARSLHDFFTITLVESALVAIMCAIGFYLAGIPGWFILALLNGFLNIVPYVGPILGAVPAVAISLLLYEPSTTIYVIATILIAQLIDYFYIVPFMISRRVEVEPLVGIVLIILGAEVFGMFGMIFAIPMYLVARVIIVETYRHLTGEGEQTSL